MSIRNKWLSVLWKIATVAVGTFGLLGGSGVLAGAYSPCFPHMFTNLSNMAVCLYFLAAAVAVCAGRDVARPMLPQVKYTLTMSILVTMLIAHFMLFDTLMDSSGRVIPHMLCLHYIVPIMTLGDWLLFDEKGRMRAWGPLVWPSFLLGYAVFTLVFVGVFGGYMGGGTTADITRYPYTFLDPALSGWTGVAAFIGVVTIAVVVLGYVIFGLDRLLARLDARRADDEGGPRHLR